MVTLILETFVILSMTFGCVTSTQKAFDAATRHVNIVELVHERLLRACNRKNSNKMGENDIRDTTPEITDRN